MSIHLAYKKETVSTIFLCLTSDIQFMKIFSRKEEKSKDVSVKRAKLLDPLTWTSSSRGDDADLSSSPDDTSTSSNASGLQKIVPLDVGVSSSEGFS